MKKITIVTDFLGDVYRELSTNIREVFGDRVIVESCTIDTLKEGDKITGDIILVMLEERLSKLIKHIDDNDRVVVVSRTFRKETAQRVFDIPEKSKVLVVNDYYETALQMTSLFYKWKLRNLELITYNDRYEYKDVDYAITASIPEYVPSYVKNIIDVGVRCLDASTMITIIHKLNLNDQAVNHNLLKYMGRIVTLEEGVGKHYQELFFKTNRLNTILEKTSDGIILINEKGRVLLSNDLGAKIFESFIVDDLVTEAFHKNFDALLERADDEPDVVKLDQCYLMASAKTITCIDDTWEKMIVANDITEVRKMEQIVSHKLREKGLYAKYSFDDIVYKSEVMKECLKTAKLFATTNKTVLINGESGTGKELLAQSIHNASARQHQPFVAINCAALPESLLESELFGYEAGAFTGANRKGKVGLFEQAQNGTILLDEIGDMPVTLQSRLLRVIQERQVMRIGSDRVLDIDVRIIASTNKALLDEVNLGNFREDLYYRLSVLQVELPPLRERKEDIIPIFERLLGEKIKDPQIENALKMHQWRGNIRELRNVSEYYSLMKNSNEPLPKHISDVKVVTKKPLSLEEVILETIYEFQITHHQGIGRSKLRNLLQSKSIQVSEYKLRQLLEAMKEESLIHMNIGRGGCKITENGMKILKQDEYKF